jgi:16S rRNA (cytosine967-C5)-methyltransferase
MTIRANQLAALASAIERVRRFDVPADNGLRSFFRAHPEMGQHDRAFVAEGVFALLRRMRSLEALAATAEPRKLAIAVLVREQGRSLRDLEPALRSADEAFLREFKSRLHDPLPPAVAHDLPDWLWDRLGHAYGETERVALARAWLAPAPFDLRVNAVKTTRDAALAALGEDGFAATPTPYSPLGIRVAGRANLAQHPWLADGRLEVQDEGSQLVGYVMAPKRSDMVVDFCAGAGGKTLLLGALMRSQGRLYAFDVAQKRLSNLTPRLKRSGLSNVHPQVLTSERDTKVKRLAGKDRSRAGGRALHRLRHVAPQSRSQVAAAGILGRGTRGEAGVDPRRGGNAGKTGRAPRLRDVQRAARRKRGHRRAVPGRSSRICARQRGRRSCPGQHRARHRTHAATLSTPPRLRWFLRGGSRAITLNHGPRIPGSGVLA